MGTAVKLQKEGVRPGVPALFLSVALGGFHGLYVEMKRLDVRAPRKCCRLKVGNGRSGYVSSDFI
jgi:hypothetical protein